MDSAEEDSAKEGGMVMIDDDDDDDDEEEEVEASLGSHSLLYVYNVSLLQLCVSKCVKLINFNIYESGNNLNNESSL